MSFLRRVKQWFGAGADEQEDAEPDESEELGGAAHQVSDRGGADADIEKKLVALRRVREASGGRGRPPRADPPAPSQSVEDALAEREAGRKASARELLARIDRGGGLRTVLRAAAALEANDTRELEDLLPKVAKEEPRFRLLLQTAAALSNPARAAGLIERAKNEGAPAWALAWSKALSTDDATVREGLVELLFADLALAKTVAARDLRLPFAQADADALSRYTAFAHGRDCIRRFGAEIVADLIDRARASGGP